MHLKNLLSSTLWTVPFLSCVLGYAATHSFFTTKEIEAPNFVGKSVQHAICESSRVGVNIRLLREKVDPDIKEGIVLEQLPKQSHNVKPNQYVFLTISKHPQGIKTPNVLGHNQKMISEQCRELGVRPKIFWLSSRYPKDFCIAQFPQAGQDLENRPLFAYVSSGKNQLVVFPDLKGKPILEVKEFLEREGVSVEVIHSDRVDRYHECSECKVVDQNLMAGSIVSKDKRLYVQLEVSP